MKTIKIEKHKYYDDIVYLFIFKLPYCTIVSIVNSLSFADYFIF